MAKGKNTVGAAFVCPGFSVGFAAPTHARRPVGTAEIVEALARTRNLASNPRLHNSCDMLSSPTVCGKHMRSRLDTDEKIVGQVCSLKIGTC